MNEPTTKEEALRLLNQLQSKFNITKRDINESFAQNVLDDKNTYNTKIRSITVDETIFKIIIPWNAEKRWGNKKENYPEKAYRNNKWYVYNNTNLYVEDPPRNILNVLSNMLIKVNDDAIKRDSAFLNHPNEYTYNQTLVTYQDNHTDAMELRIYDEFWNNYSIEGRFNGKSNKIFYKNFTYFGYLNKPGYHDSFYALGFYPVISYSEK